MTDSRQNQHPTIELRRALRRSRSRVSASERQRAGDYATRRLLTLRGARRARSVAVYLSIGAELPTQSLVTRLRRAGKKIYAPALGPAPARRLQFRPLDAATVNFNRFGIAEPGPGGELNPRFMDLVVVPLVGFDPTGARVGMGGGFYDRTFEFRRHRQRWRGPLLVGFALECQRVDKLAQAPWDVVLDVVVTESGLYPADSALTV